MSMVYAERNPVLSRQDTLKLSWKEIAWLGIISVYCVDFLKIGVYIPYVLLPIIFIFILNNKVTGSMLILFSFSITYVIVLSQYNFIASGATYLIYPICFHILGYTLAKEDKNYKKTYRLLLTIILSFATFGFLCLLKTSSLYGQVSSTNRVVTNIWDSSIISATGLNTYLSLGLSMLPVIFLSDKGSSKWIKTICFICFIASTYCTIELGNRTGLVVILASTIMVYFLATKMSIQKILKLVPILLFCLLLKFLYDQNAIGVKSYFESTLLYSRFDNMNMTQDPRFAGWNAAFWGLFEYPMGGKQTEIPHSLNYAHNMWLDVGYAAGVFPFLLLILYTGISLISLLKLTKSQSTPTLLKGITVALYSAFFMTFLVEPIMDGWFPYFNVFCLVFGILQRVNSNQKSSVISN